MDYTVTIHGLSREDIVNLFSTASAYHTLFSYNPDEYMALVVENKDDCLEDILATILLAGGSIYVYDSLSEKGDDYGIVKGNWDEESDCMMYEISMKDVLRGLEKAFIGYPDKVMDLAHEPENLDADDADIIMQHILFGEIIYG